MKLRTKYRRRRAIEHAILMLHEEGHSMMTIARMLGTTKGTVAGVIWREKKWKAEARGTWQQKMPAPSYSVGRK